MQLLVVQYGVEQSSASVAAVGPVVETQRACGGRLRVAIDQEDRLSVRLGPVRGDVDRDGGLADTALADADDDAACYHSVPGPLSIRFSLPAPDRYEHNRNQPGREGFRGVMGWIRC